MDDRAATWAFLDLSHATSLITEVAGLKPKAWLQTASEGEWLFKTHRPGTHESVAEVYAASLAALLRLPAAEYRLASWNGQAGCASRKFEGIQPGKQLLSSADANYKVDSRFSNEDHAIELVADVLSELSVDTGASATSADARGMFLGYLMFDAWIANTDRHHENWGYIEVAGVRTLAPTYDHGSAFAWRESDEKLLKRLTTRDVGFSIGHHLSRSMSALYATRSGVCEKLSLLEAVTCFARQCEPSDVAGWHGLFSGINTAAVSQIVNSAPASQVSESRKKWVVELLRINLERVLKAVNS